MNRILAWTLTLAIGALAATTAGAQATKPATAPKVAPPAPKAGGPATQATPKPLDPAAQKAALAAQAKAQGQMDVLLDEWEKQSSKVRSLQVVFERTDKMPKWGDKYYEGQAFLQSPDLACLEFRLAQVDKDGKPIFNVGADGKKALALEPQPSERIVCNGREVLQFEWDIHTIYRYPLNKEAREKALQQGPLPFLFNMRAAEAKRRYSMTLVEQKDSAQAAKVYLIRIVPREEIDQKSFREAYIYLSKQTFLPDRLMLFPVGDQERQDFVFKTIVPNRGINTVIFNPETSLRGWEIVDNPDGKAVGNPPSTQPGATPARGGQAAPVAAPNAPRRAATQAQAPARGTVRP